MGTNEKPPDLAVRGRREGKGLVIAALSKVEESSLSNHVGAEAGFPLRRGT